MNTEGKFPEPDQLDVIGPMWKRATIERWAKREWWGTQLWKKGSGEPLRGRRDTVAAITTTLTVTNGAQTHS